VTQRILKGSYGYIKAQGKREWIKTLLLFCISLGMLLLGMIITKYRYPEISWGESRNNFLTIAAVLGILPAARFMISAIMFEKAKKYSCPKELYEKVKEVCRASAGFDLFLTAYKEEYPLYSCVCTENEVLGLMDGDEKKAGRGEEHIRSILKKESKGNVSVKLFTDEKAFIDRISRTPEATEKSDELLIVICQISI
jgi:hypothetical protein